MKTDILKNAASSLLIFAGIVGALDALAKELPPPKYQFTDRFGINVHSGQVTTQLDTLSIGGALGLSHSVSTHTSNFISDGGGYSKGFSDKFSGHAVYQEMAKRNEEFVYAGLDCGRCTNDGLWVMRVFDHEGSAEFKIMQDDQIVGVAYDLATDYSYRALGDTVFFPGFPFNVKDEASQTLTIPEDKPGYLVWTKKDGTEVWYRRGTSLPKARAKGYLEKVVYPNGFTLYHDRTPGRDVVSSVRTNTGFQLKYNYVLDTGPKKGIGATNTSPYIPAEDDLNWSTRNPVSIVGVNQAVEYCSSDENRICVGAQEVCPSLDASQSCKRLSHEWPTARFKWPEGMPRAVFFGENLVTVTDAAGRATSYRVKAFDTHLANDGSAVDGLKPDEKIVPRLIAVQAAGSSQPTVSYTYANHFTGTVSFGHWVSPVPAESGIVRGASGIRGGATYEMRGWQPSQNPNHKARRAHYSDIEVRNDLFGATKQFNSLELGLFEFEESYRNRLLRHRPVNGPTESYLYDRRGNIKEIIYNQGLSENGQSIETRVSAQYPTTCDNRKTCNKAQWIQDAKGNKTHYQYHEDPGEIASVTYPANAQGLVAQTRYHYAQYYAQVLDANGNQVEMSDPIWLKSEERYCINSNYSNGACLGNDEVITRYEYEHNNLLLTGVVVDAPTEGGGRESRRTCYYYDIYGNKIGETKPKAGLHSCDR